MWFCMDSYIQTAHPLHYLRMGERSTITMDYDYECGMCFERWKYVPESEAVYREGGGCPACGYSAMISARFIRDKKLGRHIRDRMERLLERGYMDSSMPVHGE